ncbi:BtrH N-terminal domain-containing protein [Paenibacillus xylanilyticus]|uniref:BtrH N-terminal domain-containing protein n=1 Tax=Paenibacillus xylanilyticus TaxID=248903 RepID=UPI003AB03EF7
MSLAITPFKHETLNCLESQIISIALSWNKRYELMFLGKWGFSFRSREYDTASITGDRILTQMDDTFIPLEYYHGIKMEEHQVAKTSAMMDLIQLYLAENVPVILFVDSYWCPWDPGYQTYHNMHFVIVVGIDEKQERFICVDGFYDKHREHLPLKDLHQYCSVCYSIRNVEKKQSIPSTEEVAAYTWNKLSGEYGMKEAIISFSEDIIHHFNYTEEIGRYKDKWWASPLFKRLIKVSQGRLLFAEALHFMNDVRLSPIVDEMKLASRNWENLRVMLLKSSHLADPMVMLQRVANKLEEMAEAEAQILQQFSEMVQTDETRHQSIDRHYYVEMRYLVNNRAFGSFDTPGNFCDGLFFLAHDLPSTAIWAVSSTTFLMESYDGYSHDNMTARGQRVDIESEQYFEKVDLLIAFTKKTSCQVFIENSSGELQEWLLEGEHWITGQADSSKDIGYSGQMALYEKEKVRLLPQLGRICALRFQLREASQVAALTFSFNEDVHIFSITLS